MKFAALFISFFLAAINCFGQHGGRAEPKRIEFAKGRTSTTLGGTLSNAQEMDYVFAGRKGQQVTVRNSKTSLFDFRIYSDEFDVETEFDGSREFTLTLPETGDYLFFVRKKLVKSPRTAQFALSFSIK